ncbi:hypothetical protein MMC27_006101 [Xylographa pallens]|nr:hypothetical protein [Xylographa pallens]
MAKPTILLVGGAWHTADYFGPLVKVFEEAGYPTFALGLPSVGANPPATDYSVDVNAIHYHATRLIAEDKEIIAVFHSMGGIPGTDALHGLGKSRAGGAGGALALVYIASMIPTAGHSLETHQKVVGNEAWAPARQALSQGGMMALPLELALNNLYDDVEEDQAKYWSSFLKPQSVGVFDSPLAHETYKEIRSGYLLTTNDKTYSYDLQLKTVELAGFPKEMTKTIETGHTPWLTNPEEVKDFIIQVADVSRPRTTGVII